MDYDPFIDLKPPKILVRAGLRHLKKQAFMLLQDLAALRGNPLAEWLVEIKQREHNNVVNKIKRYEMYLKDIPISTDYEQLKQRAKARPIEDFFPGKLRRGGSGRMYGRCPLGHEDRNPSFVLYPDNTFHCFSCNTGGDSIAFLQKLNHIDFKTAIRLLGS